MAREYPRTRRIGEQLKRELAALIRSEGDDPRLALVSITAVDVTRDLAYAKIYITWVGVAAERVRVLEALNRMAPEFRRRLGRSLRIRTVPQLTFVYDETVERGAALSALIDQAVARDRALHRDDDEPPEQSG
jgi:ribosome-binding factor A